MTRQAIRGFATGILLTTILFAISFYINPSQSKTSKTFNEQLDEHLTKGNQVIIKKSEYEQLVLAKEELSKLPKPNTDEEKPKIEDTNVKLPANPTDQTAIIDTIIVNRGMSSKEVSLALENKKIIKSAVEFNQFLEKNRLTQSIQVGTYTLSSDMNYRTIANLLTE